MALRVASAAAALRDAESVQRIAALVHSAAEAVSGASTVFPFFGETCSSFLLSVTLCTHTHAHAHTQMLVQCELLTPLPFFISLSFPPGSLLRTAGARVSRVWRDELVVAARAAFYLATYGRGERPRPQPPQTLSTMRERERD